MRLINTKTQVLEQYESTGAPPYAILSHTWTDCEITYQDVAAGYGPGKEPGWAKFYHGCRLASKRGYDYIWIDTCCIDKTNNVELSEAINSMYHCYKKAEICFAYLADVLSNVDCFEAESEFSVSRWFTRGWTLQELLAPSKIIFFTANWTKIGSRTQLAHPISQITGIPSGYLLGKNLEHASVAMRFSWAADRITTKPEDIAYCLLGIFNIQMSLLYGEGEAGAFSRLQQKVLKTSDDQSIFAWSIDKEQIPPKLTTMQRNFSLLAPSPASFKGSRNVVETGAPVVPGYLEGVRTPTVINNKGLHLALPIIPHGNGRVLAILNCSTKGAEKNSRLTIWLHDVSMNGGRYVRVKRRTLGKISLDTILEAAKYSRISVRKGESVVADTRPQIQFSKDCEYQPSMRHISKSQGSVRPLENPRSYPIWELDDRDRYEDIDRDGHRGRNRDRQGGRDRDGNKSRDREDWTRQRRPRDYHSAEPRPAKAQERYHDSAFIPRTPERGYAPHDQYPPTRASTPYSFYDIEREYLARKWHEMQHHY